MKCTLKKIWAEGACQRPDYSAGMHDRGHLLLYPFILFYIFFILTHQKSFSWFNFSTKYYNSMA